MAAVDSRRTARPSVRELHRLDSCASGTGEGESADGDVKGEDLAAGRETRAAAARGIQRLPTLDAEDIMLMRYDDAVIAVRCYAIVVLCCCREWLHRRLSLRWMGEKDSTEKTSPRWRPPRIGPVHPHAPLPGGLSAEGPWARCAEGVGPRGGQRSKVVGRAQAGGASQRPLLCGLRSKCGSTAPPAWEDRRSSSTEGQRQTMDQLRGRGGGAPGGSPPAR